MVIVAKILILLVGLIFAHAAGMLREEDQPKTADLGLGIAFVLLAVGGFI